MFSLLAGLVCVVQVAGGQSDDPELARGSDSCCVPRRDSGLKFASVLTMEELMEDNQWINIQDPVKQMITSITKAIRTQSAGIRDLDRKIGTGQHSKF
jgi:hypothetical protein